MLEEQETSTVVKSIMAIITISILLISRPQELMEIVPLA